jgi:aminoglycoside phosphotransferase (APT) family kinase protein
MSQPEHADLHPGNVIMTAGGPRLLDWTGAVRAPVAFDLAFGHIVLIELARPPGPYRYNYRLPAPGAGRRLQLSQGET